MKLKFETEKQNLYDDGSCKVFLGTFHEENDRLIFERQNERILVINLKEPDNELVLQPQSSVTYKNLKRVTGLEIKAILEAN